MESGYGNRIVKFLVVLNKVIQSIAMLLIPIMIVIEIQNLSQNRLKIEHTLREWMNNTEVRCHHSLAFVNDALDKASLK